LARQWLRDATALPPDRQSVMLSSRNFKIVIIGFAAALLTFLVITSIATELRINKGPRCAVPLTTFCQNLKPIEE
jgi:hypothetical protein